MSEGARPTAYDVADRYDSAYFADLAERYRTRNRFARRRIANVFALLPALADRRMLDVGCGMGTFTFEAVRAGARVVGVDLSGAALAAAAGIAEAERVRACFVHADAATLPFAAAVFDVALAADFTEHLDDATLDRVAAELARVVGMGGVLVVYTPSPSHLLERLRARGWLTQEPSHIGMRDAPALEAAFSRHGFRLLRRHYLPSHLPVLEWLERAAGRWVPVLRRRIGLVLERAAP